MKTRCSLTKLATAIVAIAGGIEAYQTSAYTTYGRNSNGRANGFQMEMHKTQQSDRQRSREEYEDMKRQRATIERIEAKKRASWTHYIRQWFGLTSAIIAESDMPMLNYIDETYTVRVKADETGVVMQAIVDTAMAYTALETTDCTDCVANNDALAGNELDVSLAETQDITANSVTGQLNNPSMSYSGNEGITTFCIFSDDTAYPNAPNAANVASMPCVDDLDVHLIKSEGSTTNKYASAYLGMALGKGADFYGNTPDAKFLIMDQFVADARLDATTKKFAMALATDDGNGLDVSLTQSMAFLGNYDASALVDPSSKPTGTIQFNDNEFYWMAPLDGIRFGGLVSGTYGLNNAEVSIDTGRQCLYVPEEHFEFVYNRMMDYTTGYYISADGETVVDCGDSQVMQNIQLLINGQWVEIAPIDMLNTITTTYNSATRSTGACRVCIKESWDKKWHLGTSGLVGYLTEFDFDKKTVAMTPLTAGTKLQLEASEKPDRILGLSLFTVLLLCAAIAGVTIAFVLLVMAVYCDFNLIGRLFGGASASKKAGSGQIINGEVSLEHLEQMIENALLKRRDTAITTEDNLLTINALV